MKREKKICIWKKKIGLFERDNVDKIDGLN